MAGPYASLISAYQGIGLASARPVTPNLMPGAMGEYYATDTSVFSIWDGTAWHNISGGGGGAQIWTLLKSWDFSVSGAITTLDTTGITNDEVFVLIDAATKASADSFCIRLSTDNGATYYSTSGNYISINTAGAATATTNMSFADSSAATRSPQGSLTGLQSMAEKPTSSFSGGGVQCRFLGSASPINALRVTTITGVSINGGKIWVYGRN